MAVAKKAQSAPTPSGGPQPPSEPALCSGPASLRVKGEQRNLVLCLLSTPVTIALVGLLFKAVTVSDLLLLVIAGMVFVSLSRGRLLGSSIRVHDRQFPELHAIVASTAQRLGISPPQIFVRDDPFVPVSAVGLGEPYALMISSQYLEYLKPGELRFLVARELGHIAAGHTRLTSLLSVSGRENFAIGLIFGAWLRCTEYTADRVGMLCTESADDAIGAIAITTFHAMGRRMDASVLGEQRSAIEADQTLRRGEWIGPMPYATSRIDQLERFERGDLRRFWMTELEKPRALATAEAIDPHEVVQKRDLAPNWRRVFALFLDLTVVQLVLHTTLSATADERTGKNLGPTTDLGEVLKDLGIHTNLHVTGSSALYSASTIETLLGFFAYSAILVALSGQTLGMMVADVRVVTKTFGAMSIWRSIWRYAVATFDLLAFPIAMTGFFTRVHVHDRLSGSRLVRRGAVPLQVPDTG
jgi:Zn-dependent protease with chaperone function